MRFKYDRSDQSSLRCCLCLHVRTGTIIFGVFTLVMHLIVLGWYAAAVINPEFAKKYDLEFPQSNKQLFGIPHPKDNESTINDYWNREWSSDDRFVAMLMFVGSLIITMMLVHGALKGRSSYLLPFFCLQVFEFCVTCLTVVGYFSFIPNIKNWITAQKNLPWKEELLQMDDDWLMLITIMVVVLLLFVKSYLIGMVWSCYKYLNSCEENVAQGVTRNFDAEVPPDNEMLLPPKYEDAVRMAREEPSPPEYTEN